ncbi:MAG: hypothetical protein ACI83B_002800 [Sediminicola sp.]
MHKYLVVLFIFFNAFVSFSQQAAISTRTLRVSSAMAVFNQNIPIGTLVLDIAENKLFLAKASVADTGTQTLTTATASFELLNDVVNDSYALVATVGNYTTALTKGGTLLVRPATGVTVTITLTTTGVVAGKKYFVKKANETDGTVKVITESGLIEGTTSIETNVPYQGWILQFDGINWHIIGHI